MCYKVIKKGFSEKILLEKLVLVFWFKVWSKLCLRFWILTSLQFCHKTEGEGEVWKIIRFLGSSLLPGIREPRKQVSQIYYKLEKINNEDIKKMTVILKLISKTAISKKLLGTCFGHPRYRLWIYHMWTPTIPVVNSHNNGYSGCELPQ